MKFYCGWDGGGTKTAVLCVDGQGNKVSEACFGPLNLNGNSAETVENTICEALAFMRSVTGSLDDCGALVIGMAGTSNRNAVSFLTDRILKNQYSGLLRIAGDLEIALAGAVSGAGAILIAGTGSVCCGRNLQGQVLRTGGYGHLIDDGGSGYAIGRDILSAVARAADGRGPRTLLTGLVFRQLQAGSVRELITWLYSPQTKKKEIASLSPLLLEALREHDEAARLIEHRAVDDLCDLAEALWRRLEIPEGELVTEGSILRCYEGIACGVKERLTRELPGLRIGRSWGTPVQGAALMAVELAGGPNDN